MWRYICLFLDNEDPSIANTPSSITQNTDSGLSTAVVTWTEPTSSDNSGVVTLTSSHSPGSAFAIGSTVVTYTATDDASNMVTETFTVTVEGMIVVTRGIISTFVHITLKFCACAWPVISQF